MTSDAWGNSNGGDNGGGGGGGVSALSAERSCVDLLRVLQHRGESEAKHFVRRARQQELERRARQQETRGGGGHEVERGGRPAGVLPALGGTALRMAASASKSLLSSSPRCGEIQEDAASKSLLAPPPSKATKSFLPAALGSKLSSLGKKSVRVVESGEAV